MKYSSHYRELTNANELIKKCFCTVYKVLPF